MKLTKAKKYGLKDYSKREVNLLPREYHRIARVKFRIMLAIVAVIIALTSFSYYEYSVYNDTNALKEETLIKRYAINSKKSEIDNQKIILNLNNRIEMKSLLIDFIFSNNRSIVEIIGAFENSLNGEIYLNNLSANSVDSFVINASATSDEAISDIISRLKRLETNEGNKYFSTVFTDGITRNEDDDSNVLYLFQLVCKFEGGADYEIK